MIFKISGLVPGNTYSYFTHFDQNNNGELDFFGVIPTEPYMFTNTANQGQGPGLSREGLGAPRYESTLVTYRQPAQEIILPY
jgi:uncharacterized protein (DUF2141 family)